MEITKEQWDEMVNKVNGFETKIEELKSQNAALTTKSSELETKNSEYATKLAEWQTKLNDQQRTIDSLNQNQNKTGEQKETPKAAHKSVRFDAQKGEYVWDE